MAIPKEISSSHHWFLWGYVSFRERKGATAGATAWQACGKRSSSNSCSKRNKACSALSRFSLKKKHCRCFSEAFVQPWKPGCKSRNKIKTLTVKRCIMGNLVQGTQPLVPPKPLPGNKTSNKGVPLNFHQNILGESCVFWLFDFRVVNTWCKFRCFEFFGFAWRCLQNEKVDQRILCKWWLNQPNWAVFFELDHLSRYR